MCGQTSNFHYDPNFSFEDLETKFKGFELSILHIFGIFTWSFYTLDCDLSARHKILRNIILFINYTLMLTCITMDKIKKNKFKSEFRVVSQIRVQGTKMMTHELWKLGSEPRNLNTYVQFKLYESPNVSFSIFLYWASHSGLKMLLPLFLWTSLSVKYQSRSRSVVDNLK